MERVSGEGPCAHKLLKKQMVGEQCWYVCECGQKFRVERWDGKVSVLASPDPRKDLEAPSPKPTYSLGCATIYKVAKEGQMQTKEVDFVAASDLYQDVEIIAAVSERPTELRPNQSLAALERLVNECGAVLAFEHELREISVLGNTNVNVFKLRVEEARLALAEMRGAKR